MKKRSVSIAGHQTSVSLEEPFWDALRELAAARGVTAATLIADIDRARSGNLSSAVRVFVLNAYRFPAEKGATS
jgi:predicted DNA-binding ribbon-helix-helix protein